MFKTMAQLRKANKDVGHYFFSKETMEFFNSRIESNLYKGMYFITSESFDGETREYAIRKANEDATIDMVSDRYATLEQARKAIEEL